ncbi:MAG: hypothetical protein ACKOJI_11690, partial [Phycisphaerales bacterium]
VGPVGGGLAPGAVLCGAAAAAAAPSAGGTWVEHWLLNTSTLAALVIAGCAWALRPLLPGLFALAAVVFTSAMVVKFFEPVASPPFASTY